METETLAVAQEANYTVIALFFRASITVQLVMIALIVASVWVWAVTFTKLAMYRRARANAAAFDAAFWSGEPLDELYDQVADAPSSAYERVFVAGMTEWRRSLRDDGGLIPGVQQRVDRFDGTLLPSIGRDERGAWTQGLNSLHQTRLGRAFVGLFGTESGAYHGRSFPALEIAISGNTSLADRGPRPPSPRPLLATGPTACWPRVAAVILYYIAQR